MARLIAIVRWLAHEIDYAADVTGLRGYCMPCDSARWAWTHRHCCARQREIGRKIAKLIEKNGLKP